MRTSEPLGPAKTFLLGLAEQAGERPLPVLIAVSGGGDSMALLHLLSTWGREHGFSVTAAHFNHQLRGAAADRDEEFVRAYCRQHGLPIFAGRGDTRQRAKEGHETVEEAARTLRYAFLRQAARQQGCRYIFTAHHADDNAETMLLNLCRGTGAAGLAGIPQIQEDLICRPFLAVSRQELTEYNRQFLVPHVEDETNGDDDASRNLLRHKVLPVLREINPRAVENMGRSAALLAEQQAALEDQIRALLEQSGETERGRKIRWDALERVPGAIQTGAVLGIMERVCGHRKNLGYQHARAALDLRRTEQPGGQVSLPYGLLARNAGAYLTIERAAISPATVAIAAGQAVRFGGWSVSLGPRRDDGISYAVRAGALPGKQVTVTRWGSKDRMEAGGARGTRSVKRLCVDRHIPPAERDAMPVLRIGADIAAAPGIGVDAKFSAGVDDEALWVTFTRGSNEEN